MAILDSSGQETQGNSARFRLTWDKVLAWIIAALVAWGTVNARIAVVESKQDNVERRLDRMETKIDMLLSRP